MESKEIQLSTFTTNKGIGVYVHQISGQVLDLFKPMLGNPLGNSIQTKSERLKHTATFKAAKEYIDRFYAMPLQDQVNAISNKSLRLADKPVTKKGVLVATRVQYFRLSIGSRDLGTSFRLDEIAKVRKIWPNVSMTKTVAKEMLFDKDEFDQMKHWLVVLPAISKGGDKRDINTNFKGITTKRK